MTYEPVSSCLIVNTYKKQVDKLKLVEAASTPCPSAPVAIQFCTGDQNYIQQFQWGNMKKIRFTGASQFSTGELRKNYV